MKDLGKQERLAAALRENLRKRKQGSGLTPPNSESGAEAPGPSEGDDPGHDQ